MKRKEPPNFRCSCGRIAEWIGAISGKPECWEIIDIERYCADDTVIWPLKYPGEEPRHRKESNG